MSGTAKLWPPSRHETGLRMRNKPLLNAWHWLTDRLTRAMIGLMLALPYTWRVPLMGRMMRYVVGPLTPYRARALANLSMVWPDMPAAQRHAIASAVLDNAGRTLIENYSTRDFTKRAAEFPVTGPGLAALERATADGRPVLLVSGHYGNYEAARAALVARGYTIGGLYRPMHNPYFNAHYVRTMEAFGGPVFPQGRGGTAGFVRHLKAGGVLVLLFDQNAPGAQIPFMGHSAQTALSAAELALRFGADLIPFYGIRRADGINFDVVLEAPIAPSTPIAMTTALTQSLEARVHEKPEQWFWVHRRWKMGA
jgi:KDO2-lipid IV(A) lauroyltransferase